MPVMDMDESTRRQVRNAEADLNRQQNALPAWQLKSTNTGDLTVLGMKDRAETFDEQIINAGAAALKNHQSLQAPSIYHHCPGHQQQQLVM